MTEEINVVCPSCSPKIPTEHEILRSGQNLIVECQDCGAVHPTTIERKKPVKVRVIVSKEDISFTLHTMMEPEETIFIDDELIIDDEKAEEVYPIIVTAIESEGRNVKRMEAGKIETLWGRATDEVTAKISLKDRNGSISLEKKVPGEQEFVVGESYTAQGKEFNIKKIKIRDGGFQTRKGDSVPAKYIKRIFATEVRRRGWGEKNTSWSTKTRGRY